MRRRFPLGWWCGITFAVALLGPAVVTGQVYNPGADFSATNNPSGVWKYGWTSSLGATFNLDTAFQDPSGLSFWLGGVSQQSPPGSFPYIAHNGTNTTIPYGNTTSYPPGQLGMHPGPDGEYSVIRFTALQALLIDIEGSYFKIDSLATTDVHILDNGVSIFDGALGVMSSVSFSLQRSVVAGETIDFAIAYGGDNFFNDSTGLSATIAVPEPSSLGLSGLVMAAVIGIRWRKIMSAKARAVRGSLSAGTAVVY